MLYTSLTHGYSMTHVTMWKHPHKPSGIFFLPANAQINRGILGLDVRTVQGEAALAPWWHGIVIEIASHPFRRHTHLCPHLSGQRKSEHQAQCPRDRMNKYSYHKLGRVIVGCFLNSLRHYSCSLF